MRIRGVFVLLATLVVVMGIMAFFSLSLTGNVIEEGAETTEALVTNIETPPAVEQEHFPSPEPLLAPLSGFALSTSLTGITLHWNAPLDANKIIVWRASVEDGPWFIHEVVLAEQGAYTDDDIAVFNQYYYQIQSFDGKGLSAFSDILSALISYDGDAVAVSEKDTRLFENSDAYLDESFSESEYLRRLALYNQKTYCEILASSTGMQLQLQTLSDCGGIARVVGDGISEKNNLLRDFSISTVPSAGMGGKDFGIGGSSGNAASESPASGAGNGGNSGGGSPTSGGNAGSGAGGDGSENSGNAGNIDPRPRPAGAPCDASYARIYGNWWNCAPHGRSYFEQERDELELMKFELEELMKSLIMDSDDNETIESLLWKKQQYELLSNWYMDRRLRYDAAQHRALYQRALALEQFGMGLATRGDGEQALKAFEQAREACLEAERLGAYDKEIYTSRLCAARNALKHASILGARDPMLQEAQREYLNLAQEIDTLEDETKREQFLPIALDAYSGVMQADMREGKFKGAEGVLKQIERLDSETGKALRQGYEQALVDVIARRLDSSNVEAYELLNRKLRMDESIAKVVVTSGPSKLISYFSLDELADEAGRAQLKLTDEQIGMVFMRDAVSRGKTLKEIMEMSDNELAVLFGTTDLQRAAKAGKFMRKAWDNADVQQYLNEGAGAYIFETEQSYLDASVYGKLDDSVKADASTWDFYWSSVGQTADEMLSIEGAAMNLLPFAQLSGKVGLMNNAGKLIAGKELWKAGVQAEQMSAFGVTLAGIKNVVPGIERAGVGIHEAFAASRWGSAIGTFAARHPNSLIAIGALEGTAIGVGGTAIVEHYSPGSGIIFGTITGEFSPLAHLGGSASAATRAGIRVTTGSSAVGRNFGVTLTKSADTKSYAPVIAPKAGAQGTHDTTVFYDSKSGDTLGTSRRTVFDANGNIIPIIEFVDRGSMNQYILGMEARDHGIYRAPDGSSFLPYVKGKELPRVLPDADANAVLITGEKPKGWLEFGKSTRVERVLIGEPTRDADLPFMSDGFIEVGERVYHAPDVPETQVYVQRTGEDTRIVGAADNALVVKAANAEMQRALSERPMVVRGDETRAIGQIVCSGSCNSESTSESNIRISEEIASRPREYRISYEKLSSYLDRLNSYPLAQRKLRDALESMEREGIAIFTHPDLSNTKTLGFFNSHNKFIVLRPFPDDSRVTIDYINQFSVFYHETVHASNFIRSIKYEPLIEYAGYDGSSPRNLNKPLAKRTDNVLMVYDGEQGRFLFANEVEKITDRMVPVIMEGSTIDEISATITGDIIESQIAGRGRFEDTSLRAIELSRDSSIKHAYERSLITEYAKKFEGDKHYDFSLSDLTPEFPNYETFIFLRSIPNTKVQRLLLAAYNPLNSRSYYSALKRLNKIEALDDSIDIRSDDVLPETVPRARELILEKIAPYYSRLSQSERNFFDIELQKTGKTLEEIALKNINSLLTPFEEAGIRVALNRDVRDPHFSDKIFALRHLENVETYGIPTSISANAIPRVQAMLVKQLAPHQDKLTAGQKAVVERTEGKIVIVSEPRVTSLTSQGIASREALDELSRTANNPSATVKMFNKNLLVQTDDGLLVVSKLADGAQAVGRGSKGERDVRSLEQLIEEPREQLFQIKREDTITGSSATAAHEITPRTIDDIFKSVYDKEKSLHGAKGVVYRDEFGNYHVRFWDEGNIGLRDIHHQDALAELLRSEAEGLKRVGTITGEKRLLQIADDNIFTAKALNEDRRKPTLVYSDENLLNSEGFQFTRDSSGKVVAFDISSSMSSAQIARDIVLDGARLSEMIRAVHESIAPELRGYRIIRVEGLQGFKIRGEVSLPDGLELRELFEHPL